MRCVYHCQTNLGLFCFQTGADCEFGFKKSKDCFSFKRATLHNEKIKLVPINPPPPVPDYSKEVEKLYWAGVDPMSIDNEELREQLITRIVLEHDANENWREYVK
jgi:hypothetical protein